MSRHRRGRRDVASQKVGEGKTLREPSKRRDAVKDGDCGEQRGEVGENDSDVGRLVRVGE